MTTVNTNRQLPPPSLPLNIRRKIPMHKNMTLMTTSAKWHPPNDSNYLSPPMTNSPTSPKRTQFLEERSPLTSTYEASSGVSNPTTTGIPINPMASQVLPPRQPQAQQYSYGPGGLPPPQPPHFYDRPELQPRVRSLSIPEHGSQPTYQPSGLYMVEPPAIMLPQGYGGYLAPVGFTGGPMAFPPHHAARIPRIAPRRGKVHVAKACQNCKKAHLSCDDQRPCGRCVSSRREATCIDVEHKKRGRPRLPGNQGNREARALQSRGPVSRPSGSQSTAPEGLYDAGSNARALAARRPSLPVVPGSERGFGQGLSLPAPPHSAAADITSFRQAGRLEQEMFVAYLSMELDILKITDPLRQVMGTMQDLSSRPLRDFVDPRHYEEISSLQNQLREERNRMNPMMLPPLRNDEYQTVQSLTERDVDHVTEPFREKEGFWLFHLPNGRSEQFMITISLAKTMTFFIALVLQRPPNSAPSPGYSTTRTQSELPAPIPTPPIYPTDPRTAHFGAPGPSSPYHRPSAPGSPFSTLPQALSTSLPPVQQSSHPLTSPGREQQFGGGGGGSYFGRQPTAPSTTSPLSARMQPPPQPLLLTRGSSGREAAPASTPKRSAPAPLSNLNLPPLMGSSASAPTTPNNPEASFEAGSASHHPPGSSSSMGQDPGSSRSQRRRSVDRAEEAEEEASRKRRRLEIGGLIEK